MGRDELALLVDAVHRGTAPVEQAAALLIATVMSGLSDEEAVALTGILVDSGVVLDTSGFDGPTIDKHSTGGVADTTTLVTVPLLAACGARVMKLSGRALGHTGGTIDKLGAIPGLEVDLGAERMRRQVAEVGCAVAAATTDLAPADASLYRLRDRIAAVDDPALIASSVMSKKLAAGASNIVLDVKTGDGAFLPELRDARRLAELCVGIAAAHGRRALALITDMSRPLGPAAGDALEVAAAIEVLAGSRRGRLGDLSVALATNGLVLAGRDEEEASEAVERALADGRALERFAAMIAAQGGPADLTDDPWRHLARAPVVREWSPEPGHLLRWSCRGLGELVRDLAAGVPAPLVAACGLEFLAEVGDVVGDGRPAVRVHAPDDGAAAMALERLPRLVTVAAEPGAARPPLIVDRVGPDRIGPA